MRRVLAAIPAACDGNLVLGRRRPLRARRASPALELLEARTLLTFTFDLSGGVLDIFATADENIVFLSNDGSHVIVDATTVPGGSGPGGSVRLSDVTAIRLRGDAGNNAFFVDDNNTQFRTRGTQISLIGGDGNDTLQGGSFGPDADLPGLFIDGGSGNDSIRGARGNDTLLGGDGDDVISAGSGNDSVDAGPGDDGAAGTGVVFGGPGDDTLIGGPGNDVLFGDDGDFNLGGRDFIVGGPGDDSLTGDGGDDTLDGGDGNDFMNGRAGNDSMLGGDGSDPMSGDDGDDFLDAGPGDDSVQLPAGVGVFGGSGSDTLLGGPGNDLIFGDGGFPGPNDGDDSIDGGSGIDSIQGDGGNDTLSGGGGLEIDRLIAAGDASFVLTDQRLVGMGTDAISGFSDACFELLGGGSNGDSPCTKAVAASTAARRSSGDSSAPRPARAARARRGNSVDASGFSGKLQVFGDSGNNLLRAGAGSTYLVGAAGNDTLVGGAANDVLDGGPGNDSLSGGAGDDSLIGGAGSNSLEGGPGCDMLNGTPEACAGGAATPTVQFSSATIVVAESAGTAVITVSLSEATNQVVTVSYASGKGGSATERRDYAKTKGKLVFQPGQTERTFSLRIVDDALEELDETVLLSLKSPKNARLGSLATTTLTIQDDDAAA